jgi:dihydrofolate reductase
MIYTQFLPIADKIYLTIVNKDYEGDVFFPQIDFSEWEVETEADHPEHEPPFTYLILHRKK